MRLIMWNEYWLDNNVVPFASEVVPGQFMPYFIPSHRTENIACVLFPDAAVLLEGHIQVPDGVHKSTVTCCASSELTDLSSPSPEIQFIGLSQKERREDKRKEETETKRKWKESHHMPIQYKIL